MLMTVNQMKRNKLLLIIINIIDYFRNNKNETFIKLNILECEQHMFISMNIKLYLSLEIILKG